MVKPAEPGVRRCIKCDWFFVSPDFLRVRKCHDCRQHEEPISAREAASLTQVQTAIRYHFGTNKDYT